MNFILQSYSLIFWLMCNGNSNMLTMAVDSKNCDKLGCAFASQQQSILSLKEDISNLTCRLDMEKQERSCIDDIRGHYADIKDELMDIKQLLTDARDTETATKLAILQQEMAQLKNQLEAEKRVREGIQEKSKIAFTACAGSTKSYNALDKMSFEVAAFNYGGHYHPENSSFVCPYHGIYRFEINLLSNIGHCLRARIKKSSIQEGFSETWTCDKGSHHQSSNSVFMECDIGDVIWIISARHNTNNDDQMWGNTFIETNRCISSFSGRFIASL